MVESWAIAMTIRTLVMDNMTLAIAVRTLVMDKRTLAVSVGTLAMVERVVLGVTNKTLSMDSWAPAISRVL